VACDAAPVDGTHVRRHLRRRRRGSAVRQALRTSSGRAAILRESRAVVRAGDSIPTTVGSW
jgi:hypothetical protein